MSIAASQVKQLREKTGAGMMDCKRALEESGGDMDKAIKLLREKGVSLAAKRAHKVAAEGVIGAYVHAGSKIGVMVEVNCESDFVARTADFQDFAKNLCLQICSQNPSYVRPEDVPETVLDAEREIYRKQALAAGKPEKIVDRIAEGKLKKFHETVCLLKQPFVRDPDMTIQDYLNDVVAKMGEKIEVRRFVRYVLGEGSDEAESERDIEEG